MRFPEYTAVDIVKQNLPGGSTKPCILQVEDEETAQSQGCYVVKVFEREIENKDLRNPTLNELVAYILAEEFEFNMPKAAFVYLDRLMLDKLGKLNNEPDYYFATIYLENITEPSVFPFWENQFTATNK